MHSLSKTGKGNLDAQSPTMPSDTRATQISTNQSQFETTEANYTPHSQIVTRLSFKQTHNTSHVRKKSPYVQRPLGSTATAHASTRVTRRYGDGWWYVPGGGRPLGYHIAAWSQSAQGWGMHERPRGRMPHCTANVRSGSDGGHGINRRGICKRDDAVVRGPACREKGKKVTDGGERGTRGRKGRVWW